MFRTTSENAKTVPNSKKDAQKDNPFQDRPVRGKKRHRRTDQPDAKLWGTPRGKVIFFRAKKEGLPGKEAISFGQPVHAVWLCFSFSCRRG